ncbi:uncharacterized protein LOC132281091 isoform X2 [Cornus florida]|uniref:uncharacterized protein LOC132281091 isoform X2 n=1 Tax=Cornus florida TaxID=4283 RepID=UPI0028A0131E|nr:uncharacterized protein LOC132281091 isoform X2 [Cornus florida]
MVAESSPGRLPAGWTLQVHIKNGRRVTGYSNVETEQKFYSKNDVIHNVKMGNVCTPKPVSKQNKRRSEKKPTPLAVKTNGFPEWLPNGWIMEVKTRERGSRIGTKYKCFIDPVTKCKFYSKPAVYQYLKTIKCSSGASEQKEIDVHSASNHYIDQSAGGKSSLNAKGSQNLKSVTGESCASEENKIVVERVTVDGLPPGWIKEIKIQKKANGIRKDPYYTDPVSGYIFRSKPDVLRFLETGDISTCAIKPRKRAINDLELLNDKISHCIDQSAGGESSLNVEVSQNLKSPTGKSHASKKKKIVVERVTADGLPPGWIKEFKIQKKANGIRRDPFYTDPVSGYIFRSKPDVLRFLKTGDISTCAIKPRKSAINDLELLNDNISSQSASNGQKDTTRRRLFSGKGSGDMSNSVDPDTEGSNKMQGKSGYAYSMATSSLTQEILEEKQLHDDVIEKTAESKESSVPSSSALPQTKGSNRNHGKRPFAENGPASTPATDILQEVKLPQNGMEKLSKRKNQIDISRRKRKIALNSSCRSSKRLAGLKPYQAPDLGLGEPVFQAVGSDSKISKVDPSLVSALDGLAISMPQQLEAELRTKISHHASIGTEAPSNIEPSNKNEKPLEGQAALEQQPGRQEADKKYDLDLESELFSTFGNSWPDPCLEFAFKTLTGEIPIEDNLTIQGYFDQEINASPTQGADCSRLPDFSSPGSFQNDFSSYIDALDKPRRVQQLPVDNTLLTHGNVSLPSCSNLGPQLPTLEANK